MINFVRAISQYAKSIDPNFKIIPNHGLALLAASETDPAAPNTAYLNAIDGVGVESLWYNGDSASPWTDNDLKYSRMHSMPASSCSRCPYPTQDALQADFIDKAIDAGLVPFVPDVLLTGAIDPVNYTIEGADDRARHQRALGVVFASTAAGQSRSGHQLERRWWHPRPSRSMKTTWSSPRSKRVTSIGPVADLFDHRRRRQGTVRS